MRLMSSNSNILYHNNFVNLYRNGYDDSSNQWDNGVEGNYWKGYDWPDSNNDGIVDTPYPIPGGSSVDRYPLMAPHTGEPPTPPPSGFTVGQGAPTPAIKQLFINAYNRNGGVGVLGEPDSDVHEAFGLYQVQNFPGVPDIHGGVLMYNSIQNDVFYIHGAIWERYYIFTDKAELGPVKEDEKDAAPSQQGTTGRYTKFETGTIHWISDETGENENNPNRGKSFVTYGDLDKLYTEMGGTYNNYLGFPVMDQEERDGHGYCEFEGGYIEWDGSMYKPYLSKKQLPIADAGQDLTVFSGDPVHFDGSNSFDPDGTIVSYHWDFGDGTTEEGEKVDHRFQGELFAVSNKQYTVTLTVKDESGAENKDIVFINVKPLEKIAEATLQSLNPMDSGFARITVEYAWYTKSNGEDIYKLIHMGVESKGFLGQSHIFLWDDEKTLPIWSDNIPVFGPPKYNSYFPSPFINLFGGKTTDNLILYEGEFYHGTLVSDYDALQIIASGIGGSDISADGPGMPPLIFEVDTLVFKPDYVEEPNIDTDVPDLTFAHLASPGELRIYDSQGKVTGLVNGEIKEEIPNSKYNNELIMIPSSSNLFNYEVHGTDEGTYGLGIATLRAMESINFAASDIPISTNEIHRYIIDWNMLSNGGKGVTLQIDSEADGIFERTINAGSILTDITPPQITINAPAKGGEYILNQNILADWSAIDLESGIASATGTMPNGNAIDTTTVGTKTFTVDAVDNAGNSATKTVTYHVSYNFAGFFQPIDNLPSWNSVKAGSAVPVKFNLSGNQGLDIFATSYPVSQKIICDSTVTIDGINETSTAGSSSLSYDATADQYKYVWKTEKAWAVSCRQLQVKLKDGTYHNASFKFLK